jgi:hypothetical protein
VNRPISIIFSLGILIGNLVGAVPELLKSTVVITFSREGGLGYTESGYRVTCPSGRLSAGNPIKGGGEYPEGILSIPRNDTPVTLAQADGQEFSVISLDVAEYSRFAIPDQVVFRGVKNDGEELIHRFVPDKILDSTNSANDFETVIFPDTWTDLISFQFLSEIVRIDNVTLSGLTLESHHPAHGQMVIPELLGVLEEGFSYNQFWVVGIQGSSVSINKQRYAYDPIYFGVFDLQTGDYASITGNSSSTGRNLATGEVAYIRNNSLYVVGQEEPVKVATLGEDNVSNIRLPRPGNGKALFVNEWFEGNESFAVFVAGPDGVVTVLTSDTVLPNGKTPHYFPSQAYFTGNSFAVDSSTGTNDLRYLVSFGGGPVLLSPADGDKVPGTSLVIAGRPELESFKDSGAVFVANTTGGNGELVRISMGTAGNLIFTIFMSTPSGATTVLPGSGYLERNQKSILSGDHLVTYGPMECSDISANNEYGMAVTTPEGMKFLMIREGWVVPGLGRIASVSESAYVHGGWFYTTVRAENGSLGLLRCRIPDSYLSPSIGDFLPRNDKTVRFMVHGLTHGKSYFIQRSRNLEGVWETITKFSAGSPSRSVLGNFQYNGSEFFRILEQD